jgi:hypothetical protein
MFQALFLIKGKFSSWNIRTAILCDPNEGERNELPRGGEVITLRELENDVLLFQYE